MPVREVAGTPVTQVLVGSCTNSSFVDLQTVSGVLKGKTVHPGLSFGVTPGSRQVYTMIARSGALGDLIESGARILSRPVARVLAWGRLRLRAQCRCGRSTATLKGGRAHQMHWCYLASPETCAASALTGVITDPRSLGPKIEVESPEHYLIEDNMIVPPASEPEERGGFARTEYSSLCL